MMEDGLGVAELSQLTPAQQLHFLEQQMQAIQQAHMQIQIDALPKVQVRILGYGEGKESIAELQVELNLHELAEAQANPKQYMTEFYEQDKKRMRELQKQLVKVIIVVDGSKKDVVVPTPVPPMEPQLA